jgi:DNA (cytosine-5)-methyltransferase 1
MGKTIKVSKASKEIENKPTYISLFSGSGVGCFAFKQNDFECIATNEIIERRLNIQRLNQKCKYNSGYINGDLRDLKTKQKIIDELQFWKENHKLSNPDVIIATPPCQGMSVANHKKTGKDIDKNSLVIESIDLIKRLNPNIFILENVASFLETACLDIDNSVKSIRDAIWNNLENEYSIIFKKVNFKNFGSNSSRTRTLVVGVYKKLEEKLSPIEIMPTFRKEKSLKEVIGHLPRLKKMNEFDSKDFLHSFRPYDARMIRWISEIREGESAFDNPNPKDRPHKIVDGIIINNVNKNGNKYTRQKWHKIAPCIHTRNDQLASQNTIHPEDDRVFSIRELMLMMNIPNEFRWFKDSLEKLNSLTVEEKIIILKKEEMNIRQSIGEAVPTGVFYSMAKKIKRRVSGKSLSTKQILDIIDKKELKNHSKLINFLSEEKENYNLNTILTISEMSNSTREESSAYYTDKILINEIINELPSFDNKKEITIMEPSVGIGSFVPQLSSYYADKTKVTLICNDISTEATDILKILIPLYDIGDNVKLVFKNENFLTSSIIKDVDLIIGNPPFGRNNQSAKLSNTFKSKNIAAQFLEKSLNMSRNIMLVLPKNFLNTIDYSYVRDLVKSSKIVSIIDFGEMGFKGVLIETIFLSIKTDSKPDSVNIKSLPNKLILRQKQEYITDLNLPYWVIYRNDFFDEFSREMVFNIFKVFRDRQITNSIVKNETTNGIRVLRSRNISDSGEIISIDNYDKYISLEKAQNLSVFEFLNKKNLYLAPNMTYNVRVARKPNSVLTNGSLAILIPRIDINLTNKDLKFFSSNSYRSFMRIARNFQTRSLNIDSSSIYFYGIKKR